MRDRTEPPTPAGRTRVARAVRSRRHRDGGDVGGAGGMGGAGKAGGGGDAVSARERILDAAEELIAENGFDATSTARVAMHAGVPKGLVFHYFPTKADLLTTLVDERTDMEAFGDVEQHIAPGDVATTLARLGERFRQGWHASARMRRLVFREAETHPEVRAFVTNLYRAAVQQIRAGIDAALLGWSRAEQVASNHRNAVAEAFAGLLIQEASLGPVTGRTFDLDEIATLLAAGLQAPPTNTTPT